MADDERRSDDAIHAALADLGHKLDTVAGAVATIAGGHRDLLGHVAEAEARRGQDSTGIAQRLAALERQVLGLSHLDGRADGEDLSPLTERLDRLEQQLTRQLPELGDDVTGRLTAHTDAALIGILRLIDDRLATLRRALAEAAPPVVPGPVAGFEAGAVMGAAQAAWNRLEQRLDTEFDDLGRQLQAMASLIDGVITSTEELANRPVVSGEQLRRAASSVRDTVVSANRSRRDRRGGTRGLGPGDPGS